MNRKIILVLICIMCLLFSCAQPDNQPNGETEVSVEVQKVIDQTILKLGSPDNVYYSRASHRDSRGITIGKLTSETVTIDSKKLDRYKILVEYDALDSNLITDYLGKLDSLESGVELDSSFNLDVNPNKVYVEFNFYFFAYTNDLAFMEVRLYDDLGNDTSAKITEFSKDFLYDIINQLKLDKDGNISSGFDWKKQEPCDPDVYVEVSTDSMKHYRSGVTRIWQKRKPDLITPARNSFWTGYWIQELKYDADFIASIKDIKEYGAHEIGDKLVINGFENDSADTNCYYVHLYDYPVNCIYDYSIKIFWYENGKWYGTDYLSTDFDFNCFYFRNVYESKLETIRNLIAFMLNKDTKITALYQQYCNEKPYREMTSDQGVYIVELDSIKTSLKNAAAFCNTEYIDLKYEKQSTDAGNTNPDTKATISLINDNNTHRVVVMFADDNGVWHSSYHYMDFNAPVVNGYDLEKDAPANSSRWANLTSGKDVYVEKNYEVCVPLNVSTYGGKLEKAWQLEDGNGNPFVGGHTKGYYIYEYSGMDKSWLSDYQDEDYRSGNLNINRHVYLDEKKENCYVLVMRYQYSSSCVFYYYDGNSWCRTIIFEVDGATYEIRRWRKVNRADSEISGLINDIENNIGGRTVEIYRLFVGSGYDRPVVSKERKGRYIIEVDDYNETIEDILLELDIRKNNWHQYSNAGKLRSNTKCYLDFDVSNNGAISCQLALKPIKTSNSWIITNKWVNCGNDFSSIDGFNVVTGNADDWVSNKGYGYVHCEEKETPFPKGIKHTRLWKSTKSNDNSSSYIGEINLADLNTDQLAFMNTHVNYSDNRGLWIDRCTNRTVKSDSVYVQVFKNVIDETSSNKEYLLILNWFDNGAWHTTTGIPYVETSGFEYCNKINFDINSDVYKKLSRIGDITAVYEHIYNGGVVNYIIEMGNLKIDQTKLLEFLNSNGANDTYRGGTMAGSFADNTQLVFEWAYVGGDNNLYTRNMGFKKGKSTYKWLSKKDFQVKCVMTDTDILFNDVSVIKTL